jgi:hypothetical protein
MASAEARAWPPGRTDGHGQLVKAGRTIDPDPKPEGDTAQTRGGGERDPSPVVSILRCPYVYAHTN